jgi:hypothetical protein
MQLTDAEIADINALITRAELLLNARGKHNGTFGTYEGAGFSVTANRVGERYGLRVQHYGSTVLRVVWEMSGENVATPGHMVIEPGRWRAEFMLLPAAHS